VWTALYLLWIAHTAFFAFSPSIRSELALRSVTQLAQRCGTDRTRTPMVRIRKGGPQTRSGSSSVEMTLFDQPKNASPPKAPTIDDSEL
jgi:hypothetical protein